MLTKQDLQAIRTIVQEEVNTRVSSAEGRILNEVDKRISTAEHKIILKTWDC